MRLFKRKKRKKRSKIIVDSINHDKTILNLFCVAKNKQYILDMIEDVFKEYADNIQPLFGNYYLYLKDNSKITFYIMGNVNERYEFLHKVREGFIDSPLQNEKLKNNILKQISLFDYVVAISFEYIEGEDRTKVIYDKVYELTKRLNGFINENSLDLYDGDKKLFISVDGRTDYEEFSLINSERENIDKDKVKVIEKKDIATTLDIMNNYNKKCKMLVQNNNPDINGKVIIFLDEDSMTDKLYDISKENDISYCSVNFVIPIQAVLTTDAEELEINGLHDEEIIIKKEDLKVIEDVVNDIVIMESVKDDRISKEEALKLLIDKEFYLIGNLDIDDDNARIKFETIASKNGEFEVCKVFITEEHAINNASNKRNINKYTLRRIISFFGEYDGVSIEPYEDYNLELAVGELITYISQ